MATSKKTTETKTVATNNATPVTTTSNVVRVTLGTSTYHIWRNWCNATLKVGGVITAKFERPDKTTYNGVVTVAKSEKDKAVKILKEYAKKNSVELVAM